MVLFQIAHPGWHMDDRAGCIRPLLALINILIMPCSWGSWGPWDEDRFAERDLLDHEPGAASLSVRFQIWEGCFDVILCYSVGVEGC